MTYVYRCTSGHTVEVEQRISEPEIKVCVVDPCGAPCERIIQNTSFVLRGHGWPGQDGKNS